MKTVFPTIALLSSRVALAHPGHGAPDVHAHAWDYGFIAIGILVAGIVYLILKNK
jgi:hypothetical protein